MRTLLTLLGLPLGLALWISTLWWGPPWGLALRLEPRPRLPVVGAGPGSPWRALQVEVVRSFPGLEGLALGDRVQFDRYGVLPAEVGTPSCVWVPAAHPDPLITPLGGRIDHVGELRITAPVSAAGCPAELGPVVPDHPG